MKKTPVSYPVIWVEGELHNTPSKLTARLSEVLDQVDAQRVLMLFGFCGNAVLGIRAKNFEMIIPRVDDCISLLFGSVKKRAAISAEYAAFFITEGWLHVKGNIWEEYLTSVETYGEEVAHYIMNAQFGHYRTLGVPDVG